MAGFGVTVDLARAVRDAQKEFEAFALDRFPRAVQFALTGVAIDATNRFRDRVPEIFHGPNKLTRDALRYTVDKDLLGKVQSVDEAKADVFVLPLQSSWLKYAFGDGENVRQPGDVGIEAYFGDQNSIRVPVGQNLSSTFGIRTRGKDKIAGSDARRIAAMAAAGYKSSGNFGPGGWGVFEVRPGDKAMGRGFITGAGIYARPPRAVVTEARSRVRDKLDRTRVRKKDRRNIENRYSLTTAPTTSFTAAGGRQVEVPKVVNQGVPRMLFLSTGVARYKPVAQGAWLDAMTKAAETLPDRLAHELADRLSHKASKGR